MFGLLKAHRLIFRDRRDADGGVRPFAFGRKGLWSRLPASTAFCG